MADIINLDKITNAVLKGNKLSDEDASALAKDMAVYGYCIMRHTIKGDYVIASERIPAPEFRS